MTTIREFLQYENWPEDEWARDRYEVFYNRNVSRPTTAYQDFANLWPWFAQQLEAERDTVKIADDDDAEVREGKTAYRNKLLFLLGKVRGIIKRIADDYEKVKVAPLPGNLLLAYRRDEATVCVVLLAPQDGATAARTFNVPCAAMPPSPLAGAVRAAATGFSRVERQHTLELVDRHYSLLPSALYATSRGNGRCSAILQTSKPSAGQRAEFVTLSASGLDLTSVGRATLPAGDAYSLGFVAHAVAEARHRRGDGPAPTPKLIFATQSTTAADAAGGVEGRRHVVLEEVDYADSERVFLMESTPATDDPPWEDYYIRSPLSEMWRAPHFYGEDGKIVAVGVQERMNPDGTTTHHTIENTLIDGKLIGWYHIEPPFGLVALPDGAEACLVTPYYYEQQTPHIQINRDGEETWVRLNMSMHTLRYLCPREFDAPLVTLALCGKYICVVCVLVDPTTRQYVDAIVFGVEMPSEEEMRDNREIERETVWFSGKDIAPGRLVQPIRHVSAGY